MPDTFLCGPDDANPPRNASYWKRKTKVVEARVAELEAQKSEAAVVLMAGDGTEETRLAALKILDQP